MVPLPKPGRELILHHWAAAEQDLASAQTQATTDRATADACLAIAHGILALLEMLDEQRRAAATRKEI